VKVLAQRIESELRHGTWNHCAVYEQELQRLWPLEAKDREAKIAEFAKTYGFRLRFYQKGLCAIFDKWPRSDFTDASDARLRNRSKQRRTRRRSDFRCAAIRSAVVWRAERDQQCNRIRTFPKRDGFSSRPPKQVPTLGCKIPLRQGVGVGLGHGCWNSKFLMTTSTSWLSVGPAWGANSGKGVQSGL
jgi:hypothetical protein